MLVRLLKKLSETLWSRSPSSLDMRSNGSRVVLLFLLCEVARPQSDSTQAKDELRSAIRSLNAMAAEQGRVPDSLGHVWALGMLAAQEAHPEVLAYVLASMLDDADRAAAVDCFRRVSDGESKSYLRGGLGLYFEVRKARLQERELSQRVAVRISDFRQSGAAAPSVVGSAIVALVEFELGRLRSTKLLGSEAARHLVTAGRAANHAGIGSLARRAGRYLIDAQFSDGFVPSPVLGRRTHQSISGLRALRGRSDGSPGVLLIYVESFGELLCFSVTRSRMTCDFLGAATARTRHARRLARAVKDDGRVSPELLVAFPEIARIKREPRVEVVPHRSMSGVPFSVFAPNAIVVLHPHYSMPFLPSRRIPKTANLASAQVGNGGTSSATSGTVVAADTGGSLNPARALSEAEFRRRLDATDQRPFLTLALFAERCDRSGLLTFAGVSGGGSSIDILRCLAPRSRYAEVLILAGCRFPGETVARSLLSRLAEPWNATELKQVDTRSNLWQAYRRIEKHSGMDAGLVNRDCPRIAVQLWRVPDRDVSAITRGLVSELREQRNHGRIEIGAAMFAVRRQLSKRNDPSLSRSVHAFQVWEFGGKWFDRELAAEK